MVANAFNNRNRTGVPHRKPLPRPSGSEQFPGGRSIQRHIAQNHMLAAVLRRQSTSPNHQLATRQSLPHKIVRLAFQHQPHPLNRKRPKGLARNSIQVKGDIRR